MSDNYEQKKLLELAIQYFDKVSNYNTNFDMSEIVQIVPKLQFEIEKFKKNISKMDNDSIKTKLIDIKIEYFSKVMEEKNYNFEKTYTLISNYCNNLLYSVSKNSSESPLSASTYDSLLNHHLKKIQTDLIGIHLPCCFTPKKTLEELEEIVDELKNNHDIIKIIDKIIEIHKSMYNNGPLRNPDGSMIYVYDKIYKKKKEFNQLSFQLQDMLLDFKYNIDDAIKMADMLIKIRMKDLNKKEATKEMLTNPKDIMGIIGLVIMIIMFISMFSYMLNN